MKKFLLVLLVVCVLASVGYYVWKQDKHVKTQEITIQNQNTQIQTKEKEVEGLKLDVDSLSALLEQEKIRSKTVQTSLDSALLKVKSLQDKFMCDKKIDWEVDYSNAKTVNDSLIKWVEEEYKVQDSTYKTIWNNSKTSWHQLNSSDTDGYFSFYYLVYYSEPDMGYQQGIYSVGLQCYIN